MFIHSTKGVIINTAHIISIDDNIATLTNGTKAKLYPFDVERLVSIVAHGVAVSDGAFITAPLDAVAIIREIPHENKTIFTAQLTNGVEFIPSECTLEVLLAREEWDINSAQNTREIVLANRSDDPAIEAAVDAVLGEAHKVA